MRKGFMNQWIIYILGAVVIGILLLPITVETSAGEGNVFIGEGATRVELSVEGFSQLQVETLVVYFEPDLEKLARETLQALQEALALASGRLGIPATPLSIALFAREDFGDIRALSFKMKQPGIWPLFISRNWKSLQESDLYFQDMLYWTMPHEGIEGTVALFFYHDRRSRWIGDGLATYAGYIVAREYTPQVTKERLNYYRQQVANLLERGQVTYNLIKDFPVMSLEASGGKDPEVQRAGYVVSLAFWLGIAQRHGEETIRKFWGQMSTSPKRWCIALGLICFGGVDAPKAARILSELTGEDIWAKLQKMDLHEVLRTLEQAGTQH
jgi:hypothetical protein